MATGAKKTPAAGSSESAAGAEAVASLNDSGLAAGAEAVVSLNDSEVPAVASLTLPRLVEIVNDTPVPFVVAGNYIAGHARVGVAVNSEDEITRMKSDCEQILLLNDTHQGAEVPALRVAEVE